MLILSKAKITVRGPDDVRVEGQWSHCAARIRGAMMEMGVGRGTIRYRFGRIVFSGDIDGEKRQRIRNFLVNSCPLRGA